MVCFIYWTPTLGEKGSNDFANVSRSVGKRVFCKVCHRIFQKLLIKLGCLKGKELMEPAFMKKITFWDNAPKYPQNRVFWIL